MSSKFIFSFIVSIIMLEFSWVLLIFVIHSPLLTWIFDVWLPVLGLFWSFDIWIYPMTPLDFWEDKEIRNGIFAALAASMCIALLYLLIMYLLK